MFFFLFINLNTGFYLKGNLILNKSKILSNYIENEIFIDIITLSPLIINLLTTEYKLMDFLFIIRIIKIMQQFSRMEDEYLQFSAKKNTGAF